jgi:ubiquinone/menaquinone biosynthesis C-methylase UbiE
LRTPDVDGGTGRQALPLACESRRVLSTNNSEEMMRIAARKTNAKHLPVVSSAFDAAIRGGVLRHMANPGPSLAVVDRVLKPGGIWFHDELAADERHFNQRELSGILSAPQKGIHESQ